MPTKVAMPGGLRPTVGRQYTQQPPLVVPTLMQGSVNLPNLNAGQQFRRNLGRLTQAVQSRTSLPNERLTFQVPSVGTTAARLITRANNLTSRFERK